MPAPKHIGKITLNSTPASLQRLFAKAEVGDVIRYSSSMGGPEVIAIATQYGYQAKMAGYVRNEGHLAILLTTKL